MRFTTVIVALLLLVLSVSAFAQVSPTPPLMNFQGRLTRPDGTPVADGTYSVRFSLWSAASGGTEHWNQTVNPIMVRNGTFAVLLSGFAAGTFNANTWLEIQIGTDAAVTPRQQLVSVAYAMKANSVADGAITSASIADGTITGADIANGTITSNKLATNAISQLAWVLTGNGGTLNAFLGTTDNLPLTLRVNNRRVMRFSYGEDTSNTDPAFRYRSFNILGGADINEIGSSVVGATIAGGGYDSFTGTDYPNRVLGNFSTVGGGYDNTVNGWSSTIGGGFRNTTLDDYATVGGGGENSADHYSTIAGGVANTAAGIGAIGGGLSNTATGSTAVVAGGQSNNASGTRASIGGGYNNIANGTEASTVAGGGENTASGQYAAIPGGYRNLAAGNYSFAAGHQARANHQGAFVWADSQDPDFNSTAVNQFLIRAAGGVGINTGTPAAPLHLLGTGAPPNGLPAGNNGLLLGSNGTASYKWMQSYGGPLALNSAGNNVGIGTTNPAFKLHVNGTFAVSTMPFGDRRNVQWDDTTGQFFFDTSTRRHKENITPLKEDFFKLLDAQPVTYTRPGYPDRWEIGFIAEDFDALGLKRLVDYDKEGKPDGINYEKICLYLTAIAKTQAANLQAQQAQLTTLQQQLEALKQDKDNLRAENAQLKQYLTELSERVRQIQVTQQQLISGSSR